MFSPPFPPFGYRMPSVLVFCRQENSRLGLFETFPFSISFFSIAQMGNELCRCQGTDNSNSEGFLSAGLKTSNVPLSNSQESTQLEEEEFDNPSRELLNQRFLQTTVTASNNLLQLSPKREDEVAASTVEDYSNLLLSIYRMESSELGTSKNTTKQTDPILAQQKRDIKPNNTSEGRGRRLSIDAKIVIERNSQKILTATTPEILQSISGYILSEKNLFQPVKVAKQSFVRFKNQNIHQNYTFIDKIGQGTYGIVYKIKSKQTGELRAAKILKKARLSPEELSKLMNEINLLKRLDHPNIIKIYQAYMYENVYCIITEYCEGGSLLKHIQKGHSYSQEAIRTIMRKILSALSYIHKLNIVHRDIKLDNVVFLNKYDSQADPENIQIRIIDFGLAKVLTSRRIKDREKIGTYTHMAPEVLQGVYSHKCDIWSAGVLFYFMISGLSPFRKVTKELTYSSILNDNPRFDGQAWRRYDSMLKDLLLKMLSKSINQRISAVQALRHPFLRVSKGAEAEREVFEIVAKKFCDYNRGNNLISVIESYLAYTATTPRKQHEYTEMFEVLDSNYDGFIGKEELSNAFQRSGLTLSEGQIDYVLGKVDKNHSGKIDYSEFVTILSDRNKLFTRDSLISAFKYLDTNNNGYLQKQELKEALRSVDWKELSGILMDLDRNRDEKISQEEFIEYLQRERFI